MKKLILSAAIILGSLSTIATPLKSYHQETTSMTVQDEYTEIKLEEVPEAIKTSLKASFPTAVLLKAYVNVKKEYQLDVIAGDKKGSLWADETGKWITK